MEPLSLAFALGALGALIAGISKGGFGSSVGFLATPLLALAIPPGLAVAAMLPVLILVDQFGLYAWWRRWSWAAARPLVLWGCVGIGIGALIFEHVSADALRLALGAVAILYTVIHVAGGLPGRGGRGVGAVLGVATGLTSTIAHAGGPPVTMHLLSLKLDKTTFQATSVIVFWAINLIKLGPFAALGLLNGESLTLSAMLAPFAVAGVWIGVWAHDKAPERLYFRVVAAALLITGAKLVWDGASGLFG